LHIPVTDIIPKPNLEYVYILTSNHLKVKTVYYRRIQAKKCLINSWSEGFTSWKKQSLKASNHGVEAVEKGKKEWVFFP